MRNKLKLSTAKSGTEWMFNDGIWSVTFSDSKGVDFHKLIGGGTKHMTKIEFENSNIQQSFTNLSVKPIIYTREEAERLILNKECETVENMIRDNDFTYISDMFYTGFKGYAHYTNKQLEEEINYQLKILIKIK